MKRINKIIGIAAIALFVGACSDILEEQPRSFYEPGFFKTEKGIQNGLTSLYAHLRWIYGGYYWAENQLGTDEYTWAQSADGNFNDHDLTANRGNLNANSSRSDVLWNNSFPNINTASGIIENGEEAGVDPSLIAEAYFFRAYDYLLLVQTFGGVPLDLGSGELKFNSTPSRGSVRNTVPEVYTKCVFPDLLKAISDLPEKSRLTGAANKTVARLMLSRAYLNYAWWLENPNNIATYPETARTDPNGQNAAWYFQQAYNVAAEVIENPGDAGLMPTFYDAHLAANDRNKEMLLYADHYQNQQYGGIDLGYGDPGGGGYMNAAVWFAISNYTEVRSAETAGGDYNVESVQREASQDKGRPWTRGAPTIGVFEYTFADKVNDSRYDGTFTTTYFGNWERGNRPALTTVFNANDLPVGIGEPIIKFLPEEPATPITYPTNNGQSNMGLGWLPGESAWVVSPRGLNRRYYPGLWKMGPARTDNAGGMGSPNGTSPRPYNVAKFSEFFLIAAEAAVKGANTRAISGEYANGGSARDMLNVLRARAGVWKFNNSTNSSYVADHSAAMIAATPATIDISYILDERSRELFGEGYRWMDLVRTQMWEAKAGSYEIGGTNHQDHSAEQFNRDIKKHHYLRPIPNSQLDRLVEMTDAEKQAYQNPGY